jgi:hypothetical protein
MPVAEKFKALGVGNGFTYCLPKIDVSNYFEYKTLTLDQAVFLYWNVASATATASSQFEAGLESVSIGPTNLIKEPKNRGTNIGVSSTGEFETDPDLLGGGSVAYAGVGVKIPDVYRIYQGSTGDETNFLGYSFGEIAHARAGEFYLDAEDYVAYQGMIESSGSQIESLTIGPSSNQIPVFKVSDSYGLPEAQEKITADVTAIKFYTYPA